MTGPAHPPGARLELTLGKPAAGGACVARTGDGQVVFVRHGLPGERVVAEVTSATSSYLRADAVEVLDASGDRVPAPCPHAGPGRCGGCDWQHAALPAQRRMKAVLVSEHLARLAGWTGPVEVEAVEGSPDGLAWRSRVQFGVDARGRVGFRRHRSHELVPVERCRLGTSGVQWVGAERRLWPGATAVEVAATADGSQRVAAVTSRTGGAAGLPPLPPGTGSFVDGRPRQVPHGLRCRVLGRDFEVSAGTFWQVHPSAPAVLAGAVLDGLRPQAGERAVDLYAGAGLFTALIAERVGVTGSVLAVEAGRRAAADAARNTADLPQVRVRTAEVAPELVARGLGRPDLVVLDPPRTGAGTAVARALSSSSARAIAYVACDAASLARDLKVFLDAGWEVQVLRAFDLFPMTEHVEVVAVLGRPAAAPIGPPAAAASPGS